MAIGWRVRLKIVSFTYIQLIADVIFAGKEFVYRKADGGYVKYNAEDKTETVVLDSSALVRLERLKGTFVCLAEEFQISDELARCIRTVYQTRSEQGIDSVRHENRFQTFNALEICYVGYFHWV